MQNKLNKVLWWLLMIMPFLLQIVGIYTNIDIWQMLGISDNHYIVNILNSIFNGNNAVINIASNNYLWYYIGYLFNIQVAHLVFDLMILIIRICHSGIDKLNKGGET